MLNKIKRKIYTKVKAPIVDALKAVKTDDCQIYLMAPVGQTLSQKKVRELAETEHLVLVCGHYEVN